MLASSRTTKTMWLAPPLSTRISLREIDARDRRRSGRPTTPTPPSCRSRPGRSPASLRQAGWFCGSVTDGLTVATLRAPMPAVVAHPVDVEPVVAAVVSILKLTVCPD